MIDKTDVEVNKAFEAIITELAPKVQTFVKTYWPDSKDFDYGQLAVDIANDLLEEITMLNDS